MFEQVDKEDLRIMIKYGYVLISLFFYIFYNYRDAKNALIKFREKSPNSDIQLEINEMRYNIKYFDNFFSSIFFPFSVSRKIIPMIVIFFNPKK